MYDKLALKTKSKFKIRLNTTRNPEIVPVAWMPVFPATFKAPTFSVNTDQKANEEEEGGR
jgi:hypothetical protein